MRNKLGKIRSVKFGFGGYQDAQFGVWFTLGGDCWEVGDGSGVWQKDADENTKWTQEDKEKEMIKIMKYISDLLYQAKVSEVHELEGKPVEIEWNGKCLKSWRLLTEVI